MEGLSARERLALVRGAAASSSPALASPAPPPAARVPLAAAKLMLAPTASEDDWTADVSSGGGVWLPRLAAGRRRRRGIAASEGGRGGVGEEERREEGEEEGEGVGPETGGGREPRAVILTFCRGDGGGCAGREVARARERPAPPSPPSRPTAAQAATLGGARTRLVFRDNTTRVQYSPAAFHPSGSDLPAEPVVLVGVCDGWVCAGEGKGTGNEEAGARGFGGGAAPRRAAAGPWTPRSLAARCGVGAMFELDGGPGFARESMCGSAVGMGEYAEYCARAEGLEPEELEDAEEGEDREEGEEESTEGVCVGRGEDGVLRRPRDAPPLYIFDPQLSTRRFAPTAAAASAAATVCFGGGVPLSPPPPSHPPAPATLLGARMASEFSPIPRCFLQDTMAQCAASRPLPRVWLLVGARGSGTPVHNHPATAAWNALLAGCKLWAVLPPETDPAVLMVGESNTVSDDVDLSAADWLAQWDGVEGEGANGDGVVVDEAERGEGSAGGRDDVGSHHSRPRPRLLPARTRIVVQMPGETVFAPAGWWHVVLNVRAATALSHSLALRRDFEAGMAALEAAEGAEGAGFREEWGRSVAALDRGEWGWGADDGTAGSGGGGGGEAAADGTWVWGWRAPKEVQ